MPHFGDNSFCNAVTVLTHGEEKIMYYFPLWNISYNTFSLIDIFDFLSMFFLPNKRNVGISLKSDMSDMSELPDMSMMTVISLMSVISVISEKLSKLINVF